MDDKQKSTAIALLASMEKNLEQLKTIISGDFCITEKVIRKQVEIQEQISIPEAELGPIPDYTDDDWPKAIDSDFIVGQGEIEKQFRATQIVESIEFVTKDLSVLDFGCGEGHVAHEISQTANKVVGFDKERYESWDAKIADNLFFITDHNIIKSHAPYDLIILYDVIDHMLGDHALTLKRLGQLLNDDGKIFIRAHPWTSRHGSHLYEKINKAYLHLIVTPDEVSDIPWGEVEYTHKIVRPMGAYESWFKHANLEIISKDVQHGAIEEFFDELLDRIIKITWNGKIDRETAKKIMSIEFIDYVLENKGPVKVKSP
jgi:2-polyprenyl-3-methyl-5-hydroxy-6-metoxy-1,4-benzoquinol methylase